MTTNAYSVTTVTTAASGNTVLVTPDSGHRLRLFYLCLNADGGNAADVTAALRFGASGDLLYTVCLKAGSIFGRNIGAAGLRHHVRGQTGEALYVNLSAAETVNVTVEWEESA